MIIITPLITIEVDTGKTVQKVFLYICVWLKKPNGLFEWKSEWGFELK